MSTPASSALNHPFSFARRLISGAPHPHLESLHTQARRADSACQVLAEFMDMEGDEAALLRRISELEEEALAANLALSDRLRSSFITPLDPEDVLTVSTGLLRVVQAMRRASDAGRELPSRRDLAPIQRQLTATVRSLGDVVRRLERGGQSFEGAAGVLRLHREVKASLRIFAGEAVRGESDVRVLIAKQRMHGSIEEVLLRVRKTAKAVQWLILKNG